MPTNAADASRPVGGSSGSARSLLLTILGEFVRGDERPVWTATLLYVLSGLGVEGHNARQAIARASRSGWINGERLGREVCWRLTPEGMALLAEGERRVYALTSDDGPWDGRWLIIALSIPKSRAADRRKIYTTMQRRGFGNPIPGLWLSPHPLRGKDIELRVARLGLRPYVLAFVGSSQAIGLEDAEVVARSWALDPVAAKYHALLRKFRAVRPRSGDSLLLTHLRLVNEWQHMPLADPQLPVELLPDWIGRQATSVFVELRQRWSAGARTRWEQIGAETAPRL